MDLCRLALCGMEASAPAERFIKEATGVRCPGAPCEAALLAARQGDVLLPSELSALSSTFGHRAASFLAGETALEAAVACAELFHHLARSCPAAALLEPCAAWQLRLPPHVLLQLIPEEASPPQQLGEGRSAT